MTGMASGRWPALREALGASGGNRRSDFDITNTVRVSSPPAVLRAITQLLASEWPGADQRPLARAFADFDAMFAGRMPGYLGVDTVYHDRQHTLDVTLAMARLVVGYERQAEPMWKLGPERALVGVVLALFHDVGYLRRASEAAQRNGAEFTRNHVSRGVEFLRGYLPQVGYARWVDVAAEILHFTGYERALPDIILDDARDLKLGHLLGTADMIAQMADRCYLEKCRDRLYPEFVLAGSAFGTGADGAREVRYASGLDLLRQTPGFVAKTREERLDTAFSRIYRCLEALFDGRNPYIEAIDRNVEFLERVLRSESWRMLRRNPPLTTASPDTMDTVRTLVVGTVTKSWLPE
ncbi:MAG: HD domain-containing protein [Steroidobacteraceae bacterium]